MNVNGTNYSILLNIYNEENTINNANTHKLL